MAVYKVPQDVEADDKLLGPFSFRQFIYLIIVALSMAIAWVLGNLLLPLVLIPLPIILLFGALALPLRKDQPMETYLAALIAFYIKPRKRMWDPDGQQALVEITAPKVAEVQRTKDLSQDEAEQRLSYLANLVDSRGWAVRGVEAPTQTNSALNSDVYFEAQHAEDVFDESTRTSHIIDTQLDQSTTKHRQELIAQMQRPPQPQAPSSPTSASNPYTPLRQTSTGRSDNTTTDSPKLTLNPYPNSMHQSVIQPLSEQAKTAPKQPQQNPPKTPSEEPLSPDIIKLANNPDLSIETIAHEANRIKQKQGLPDDEVIISLH